MLVTGLLDQFDVEEVTAEAGCVVSQLDGSDPPADPDEDGLGVCEAVVMALGAVEEMAGQVTEGVAEQVVDAAEDPGAKLSLSKVAPPVAVQNGDLVYTLTVRNEDPLVPVAGATITDPLPPSVEFKSSDGCGQPVGSNEQGLGGTVTCEVGPLLPKPLLEDPQIHQDHEAVFEITVRPRKPDRSITNIATVAIDSPQSEVNPSTANATAVTDISRAETDLVITKDDDAGAEGVPEGEELTYTLGVTNEGDDNATGVTVRDDLPESVRFESASAGCGEPTDTGDEGLGGTVTCEVGELDADDGEEFEIVVTPQVPDDEGIVNTATVTSNEEDPKSASVETQVNPVADLEITKTADEDEVLVGDELTYTLEVANLGPSGATGVTVTDTLDETVDLASASEGCDEHQGTVTCEVGELAEGEEREIELVVVPREAGQIENTAEVLPGAEHDLDLDNNLSDAVVTQVDPVTDLAITKAGDETAFRDAQLTYTLEVANLGPSDATGVTVTDTLDETVDLASAEGCDEDEGTVTCEVGELAAAAGEQFDIVVIPQEEGEIQNTATVSGDEHDPAPDNNTSDPVVTEVEAVADLTIAKDADATAIQNDELVYSLTVENQGPSHATDVTITDALPGEVEFSGFVGSAGEDCDEVDGTVTCEIGDLDAGDDEVREFEVIARETGEVRNTAVVAGNESDPVTSDEVTTDVLPAEPEIGIVKTADPDPAVTLNASLTYTITLTNITDRAGETHNATGVTITDELPGEVEFVGFVGSAGESCEEPEDRDEAGLGGTVTCVIGDLDQGESEDREFEVVVRDAPEGGITNDATVDGNEFDPVTSDVVTTTVDAAQVSLDLELSADRDRVIQNDDLTYVLTVTNEGPDNASGVTITNTLPEGGAVDFRSAWVADDPARCVWDEDQMVTCDIGNLDEGDSATAAIEVRPRVVGNINNAAKASASQGGDTDQVGVPTEVVPAEPSISIVKSSDADPDEGVFVEEPITYTIEVTNDGQPEDTVDECDPTDLDPDCILDELGINEEEEGPVAGKHNATGVTVTDTLDGRVDLASASEGCDEDGGIVTCEIGELDEDEEREIELVVIPGEADEEGVTNTASVHGNEFEAATSDEVTTPVHPLADLTITKDAEDQTFVGDELTYTLEVANLGPSTATGVTVTDELHESVDFDSAEGCDEDEGVVTCEIGDLAADAGEQFELVVVPQEPGPIENTAEVVGIEHDPDLASNISDTVVTQVNPVADLEITKTADEDEVLVGDELTYTLEVANLGPSDATGVTVTDELPETVDLASASDACDENEGTVTCGIDVLGVDDEEQLEIVVVPQEAGEIVITATVTGGEFDPHEANNASSATTTVGAPPVLAEVSPTQTAPPPPPPAPPPPPPVVNEPPEAKIANPKRRITNRRPVYRFGSDDPDAVFQCRLRRVGLPGRKKGQSGKRARVAGPPWKRCSSPLRVPRLRPKLKRLRPGIYVFRVRAIDAEGVPGPVTRDRFRIVRRQRR